MSMQTKSGLTGALMVFTDTGVKCMGFGVGIPLETEEPKRAAYRDVYKALSQQYGPLPTVAHVVGALMQVASEDVDISGLADGPLTMAAFLGSGGKDTEWLGYYDHRSGHVFYSGANEGTVEALKHLYGKVPSDTDMLKNMLEIAIAGQDREPTMHVDLRRKNVADGTYPMPSPEGLAGDSIEQV